jgi:hypothetical protein
VDYEFRLTNKGVESPHGFVVLVTGRFSLEYRAGSFLMECSWEPGMPYSTVSVPPLPFGNLTPERHADIKARVSAALDFMGIDHVID